MGDGIVATIQTPFARVGFDSNRSGIGIIWLPMIVNDNSDDIRQETAALGADTIEGQQGGGRNMQPLRLAADAKPRLVHVLHRRAGHEITHPLNKTMKTFGASSRSWRWPL